MDHFSLLKTHAAEMLITCWYCAWIKAIPSLLIAGFAFLFGLDNHDVLIGLVALLSFDAITGVFAAKVQNVPIQSRRFLKTASKLAMYGLLCSAGFVTDSIVPGQDFIFAGIATYLAVTELISIMENIGKMGYSVPLKLLNQLKELTKSK